MMGLVKRNCREVTRLVLAGEDRRMSWWERLIVRTHLKACQACPRFVAQVDLMRRATARWRRYAENDSG